MKLFHISAATMLTLAMTGGAAAAQTIAPVATDVPAGTYTTDPIHSRLIFSVNHLGFSNYTAFFRTFEGKLVFDPADPEGMSLNVMIDPASVETMYKDATLDFNTVVAGKELLDAATFPEMSFISTAILLTAPDTADVTGDFTMHGVTKPLTLNVKFNGGYPRNAMDPGGARIGFSATGSLKRSDYGISMGIPAPGTTMGVSDEVAIRIETEMLNPDAP